MKDGISFYPKAYLLGILSGLAEIIHKVSLSQQIENSDEAYNTICDTLKETDSILYYITTNKILHDIQRDEKEWQALTCELDFHNEMYKDKYEDMYGKIADDSLSGILKKVGLRRNESEDDEDC